MFRIRDCYWLVSWPRRFFDAAPPLSVAVQKPLFIESEPPTVKSAVGWPIVPVN
jgi:hypothetical protein